MYNSTKFIRWLCAGSIALLLAISCSAPVATATTQLPDLAKIKQRLIEYHDSGNYSRDIATTVRKALYYLRFRVTQNQRLDKPKKLAIVMDIDETALSNYEIMHGLNFGGKLKAFVAELEKGNDPAIQDSRVLFNYAIKHNVSVFFITGRPEHERNITIANLHKDGYQGWKQLFMKPSDYKQASVVPYKSSVRKHLVKAGYDIVLNIGDQNSDLAGGFADQTFKLPNPYYYVR